jgi:hypothetical protein
MTNHRIKEEAGLAAVAVAVVDAGRTLRSRKSDRRSHVTRKDPGAIVHGHGLPRAWSESNVPNATTVSMMMNLMTNF